MPLTGGPHLSAHDLSVTHRLARTAQRGAASEHASRPRALPAASPRPSSPAPGRPGRNYGFKSTPTRLHPHSVPSLFSSSRVLGYSSPLELGLKLLRPPTPASARTTPTRTAVSTPSPTSPAVSRPPPSLLAPSPRPSPRRSRPPPRLAVDSPPQAVPAPPGLPRRVRHSSTQPTRSPVSPLPHPLAGIKSHRQAWREPPPPSSSAPRCSSSSPRASRAWGKGSPSPGTPSSTKSAPSPAP